MATIQNAFQLNGTPYLNLQQSDKDIIDTAVKELKEWECTILSFNEAVVNIITNHPERSLIIDTKFPEDLTGKMVSAWLKARYS